LGIAGASGIFAGLSPLSALMLDGAVFETSSAGQAIFAVGLVVLPAAANGQ
jgi:hypothetical protein